MRRITTTLLAAFVMTAIAGSPIQDIPLKTILNEDTSLKAYDGKVLLIVNVASQCGYTPQYEGLEALWKKYKERGVVVLGFPCNDFGGQEPGTNGEIQQFCKVNYGVSFPLFDKVSIKGSTPHPLYKELIAKAGDVGWNFTKFLIGKDGGVISRFDSDVEPADPALIAAIEKALK